MKKKESDEGFITLIIFFIIALALIKYFFDWSIFEASSTPQGQETVGYTKNLVETVWFYLKTPFMWLWGNILSPVLGLLWNALQGFLSWANDNRAK